MHLDVLDLRAFYYRTRLGRAAQKMIRDQVENFWPSAEGETIVGFGFAVPMLRPYLTGARRVIALMPGPQGVMPWPALNGDATPSVWIGGWNQSVNAKSANVDAAKAYVQWLWIENAETQIDWNLGYGFHVPPRATTAPRCSAT